MKEKKKFGINLLNKIFEETAYLSNLEIGYLA